MIEIDAVTFTVLIILAMVLTAILVDALLRRVRHEGRLEGRREGEEVGKLRERALWWERTARAADRVAMIGVVAPSEKADDDWPLKEIDSE